MVGDGGATWREGAEIGELLVSRPSVRHVTWTPPETQLPMNISQGGLKDYGGGEWREQR